MFFTTGIVNRITSPLNLKRSVQKSTSSFSDFFTRVISQKIQRIDQVRAGVEARWQKGRKGSENMVEEYRYTRHLSSQPVPSNALMAMVDFQIFVNIYIIMQF